MGCHFLLQGIILTQGSNPGLLHCRQMLYHLFRTLSKPFLCSFSLLFFLVRETIFLVTIFGLSLLKVPQWCPTLWDPMDYIVNGILQAKILESVDFPFSRGSSQPRNQSQVSCNAGRFFTSLAKREVQEYWSGYPIHSPADLPNPGIELGSSALQADHLPMEL